MKTNRRTFLKTSLSGAALAMMGGINIACADSPSKAEKKSTAQLKISFQEGTAPGNDLNEKLDYMEQHGVVGFEPGGWELTGRVDELQKALRNRNIQISAICAGFKGFVLAEDPAVLKEFMDSMKEIIAAAGALGSTGVIMVPAFNNQQPALPHTMDTRKYMCEKLGELGEFALANNTTIILEPLNRGEAFYLRQVADAASICRDIPNGGVMAMGDFWHMTFEETSDMGALISGGDYLQHVHIASRKRRSMPGEDGDADNYIDGFKALKMLNYQKYISFECGCQGDRNIVLPEALKLIREQWDKA